MLKKLKSSNGLGSLGSKLEKLRSKNDLTEGEDLEAQADGAEGADGHETELRTTRLTRLGKSTHHAFSKARSKLADTRFGAGLLSALHLDTSAEGSSARGGSPRALRVTVHGEMLKKTYGQGFTTRRHAVLNQMKDNEERSRVAALRAKMKMHGLRAKHHDEDVLMEDMEETKDESKATEFRHEDNKGANDRPEEGEISDTIGELVLSVEPSVEMLGDPWLVEQRRTATLDVKSEKVITSFKKHKALAGKLLFEAENGNNAACEQFHLGDIEGAIIYFGRALELASTERKPAAKELEDFRDYLKVNFGSDEVKFYAELSAGEWRSALGRRQFIEALKGLNYPGNAERLFVLLDSIAHDGKIALGEIQFLLKLKAARMSEFDLDLVEKGVVLQNLGACLIQSGDYMAALANLREAMGIILAVSPAGRDDHNAQRVMGNIAVAYIRLEDYDTALDTLGALQELRERRWGRTHSEVLTVLFHIGYCFLAKASHYKLLSDCIRMDGRAQEKPVDFSYSLCLCAFKERLVRQQEVLVVEEEELAKEYAETGKAPDRGNADQLRLDISRTEEIVAEVHQKQGQPNRAQPHFWEAVKHREAILADTDPELLSSWNTLAACLLKTGAFEQALGIMERATRASAMLFGDVSSTVATMNTHLALVLFKIGVGQSQRAEAESLFQGTFDLALEKLETALEMQQELHGEESLEVASTAQLLGSVYLAKGNKVQARKRMEESLMKRLVLLGRTAIPVASSAHALGALYARTPRRNEEAIQLLRKASLIREKRLGDSSLYLAESLHEQGCALLRRQTQEDADHALTLLSKAAKIREKKLGKQCSTYATSMHQVGQAHVQLGLYEEGRLYLQAAVELRENHVGRKSAQAASSHYALGIAFYYLEEYRKAMKHFKASYSKRELLFGLSHPLSADSLHQIGMVYLRKKEYLACLPFLKKSLDVRMVLNQRDVTMLEDDSDEDEKNIHRPESERQRRIRFNREKRRKHMEKEATKNEKERERAEKKRLKDEAKHEAAMKKKESHKQRKKEALEKRRSAGPTTMQKLMSKITKRPIVMEAEAKTEDEEESSSEEEEEGEEKGEGSKRKGRSSLSLLDSGASMTFSASEDSEVDVSEVGVDVRGWLAGTVGHDMYIISNVYADMKDYKEAKYYLDRAICLQEEVFGSLSIEYAQVLHAFGLLHVRLDERVKALGYFIKALAVRERVVGHASEDTASTEIQLGETLAALNQPDEALVHLLRGCDIRENLFGVDDAVSMHLREKWAGLSAGATYYDPVPEGETLPHFARRSPESFLHGYMDRLKLEEKNQAKLQAEAAAIVEAEAIENADPLHGGAEPSEAGTASQAVDDDDDGTKSQGTAATGQTGRSSVRSGTASKSGMSKSAASGDLKAVSASGEGADLIAASATSGLRASGATKSSEEDIAASGGLSLADDMKASKASVKSTKTKDSGLSLADDLKASRASVASTKTKGSRVSIDDQPEVA